MLLTAHTPTRRRNLDPVDYSKSMSKMTQELFLSRKEEALKEALSKVEHDSIWGIAIRDSFVDFSVFGFRRLINELKSQMHDDELTMYKILGKDAFDALKSI